jgi:phosphatidate cytidylyltransferase
LLITRIITALVLGGVVTAAVLFLPTSVAVAVFAALWTAGGWEWGGMARLETRGRLVFVAVLLALMATTFTVPSRVVADAMLAVALVWWAVALIAVLRYPLKFAAPFVIVAGGLVLVPSWALLAWLHGGGELGRGLTMTVLVIVWAADIGAYAAGRLFGRVKLAPQVSPGKTWEGVTGGVVLAAVAAWAAARLLDLPAPALVWLGIASALVSVLGDLTASMFKRQAGLKDSGRLLPGHGGVMDRIDSLTAAVPVFVLGLKLAGVAG